MGRKRLLRKLNIDVDLFIDEMLHRSKKLRGENKKVRRAQDSLRAVVNEDGWRAYLEVEARTNARASKELRFLFHRMLRGRSLGA